MAIKSDILQAAAKTKRPKMGPMMRREAIDGYLFIMPWLIGFLLFMVIPMITSLVISFSYWDVVTEMRWAGFDNYTNLFKDSTIPNALKNTFVYSFTVVPLCTIIGLAIALLMNQKIRGIVLFRTIFYLPSILPSVAVAIVWVWILNSDFGMINNMLALVGIKGPMWLDDPNWAMTGILMRAGWGAGSSMIMFLAALQNVPISYYEASKIDGAGPVRNFFAITLPMITPTLLYYVVTGLIQAMQEYVLFKIMTDGGPSQSTTTFVFKLYGTAFERFNMGYASAMAWVMFAIVLVLTLLLFKSSSKWVYYESGDRA